MIEFASIRKSMPLLTLGVVLSLTQVACTTNPATGQRQLNVLSRAQEVAIGEDAKSEITGQYGGAVEDAAAQAYIDEVGQRLLEGVEEKYAPLPWEFTLLDSDVINAFALPGGKVFITRGLASRLKDEAQLAGVLSHEIGHVTAEHADKRVSNQLLFEIGMAGVEAAAGSAESELIREAVPTLVGVGGQGFLLKFSRDEELVADSLGIRYMTRAGYDPMGQVEVMNVLKEASDGAAPPEFLSTHPHPETRIEELTNEIRTSYPSGGYQRYPSRYQSRLLSRLN